MFTVMWTYRQHEGSHDGIIDFTVEKVDGYWKNLITVRGMRDVSYDSRSHLLMIDENREVTIENNESTPMNSNRQLSCLG
jgi:KaiC/GvpD/RAD55 family RecA-like ATPase